jgi:hypothetical protein
MIETLRNNEKQCVPKILLIAMVIPVNWNRHRRLDEVQSLT